MTSRKINVVNNNNAFYSLKQNKYTIKVTLQDGTLTDVTIIIPQLPGTEI